MDADQLLDNYNELQKIELRKNLNTYTLKELKTEIIKMKADKFAVPRMKRDQVIELILAYHYLLPHLLTKQGGKRSSVSKKRANNQLIKQLLNNPVYDPPSLKHVAAQAIPQKPKTSSIPPPSIKLDPNVIDPAGLQDIPPELLQQLFPTN